MNDIIEFDGPELDLIICGCKRSCSNITHMENSLGCRNIVIKRENILI